MDGSAEQDARTTSYAYNIGTDNSGWILGTPLQTTQDPGASPHLNLTTTTLHDASTGQITERRLPANPAGGDAHSTLYVYYTAGTNTQDAACSNKPEWAPLPCKTLPAAQPGTAGLPALRTTQVAKYNMFHQPEISVDTNGSVTRTTTLGFDAAGRTTTDSITSTIGATLSTETNAYDPGTGLPTTTTAGTRTVTRSYDALGRLTTYQDADGNTGTRTYDLLDRIASVSDGKATTTYTYDDGSEERGLPTTISDSAVGTFTATYDLDGQLATQTYPGGLTATYTHDEAGEPTNEIYTKGTGLWPSSPTTYNIHGQQTNAAAFLTKTTYEYDSVGRLADSMEQSFFNCVEQSYTFDADGNRTQLDKRAGPLWGGCPPGVAPATTHYTYDAADRTTDAGYSYDALRANDLCCRRRDPRWLGGDTRLLRQRLRQHDYEWWRHTNVCT